MLGSAHCHAGEARGAPLPQRTPPDSLGVSARSDLHAQLGPNYPQPAVPTDFQFNISTKVPSRTADGYRAAGAAGDVASIPT